MPFNDARVGWVVALLAILFAAIGSAVTISARAGALENRVGAIETGQASRDMKLDAMAAALARIEGRLIEKERSR